MLHQFFLRTQEIDVKIVRRVARQVARRVARQVARRVARQVARRVVRRVVRHVVRRVVRRVVRQVVGVVAYVQTESKCTTFGRKVNVKWTHNSYDLSHDPCDR
jgi:uncharacterized protein YaaW (UPF0174 family)